MSNRIVGVILFAFLIFITMKGDLIGYLRVLGLAPGDAPAKPAPIADVKSGGGTSSTIKTALDVGKSLIGFL